MTVREYTELSRSPRYTILFAAPLLAAYEIVAWLMRTPGGGVRNGADVMLKAPFVALAGPRGVWIFEGLLVLVGVVLIARDWRAHRGPLRGGVFALMLGEAVVLSALVGAALRYATAELLHFFSLSTPNGLDLPHQLMVSLGAGIYEELLFRVILVSAIAWVAERLAGTTATVAAVIAVILSALIFSAFHYIGVYGDPFQVSSFVFRALAGLVFSTLYVTRGFGVTAWTHALYDVGVTLVR